MSVCILIDCFVIDVKVGDIDRDPGIVIDLIEFCWIETDQTIDSAKVKMTIAIVKCRIVIKLNGR
ncbi:hypothetical protein D3C85_1252190 [compost metagenome]